MGIGEVIFGDLFVSVNTIQAQPVHQETQKEHKGIQLPLELLRI